MMDKGIPATGDFCLFRSRIVQFSIGVGQFVTMK